MTRKEMTSDSPPWLLFFGATVIFCLTVLWLWNTGPVIKRSRRPAEPAPPAVPADKEITTQDLKAHPPVDATPVPTVLRVRKLEEHVAARLLILDDDRVIPYDKLLIHADGAVVRDRSTGEEFTIIVETGLSALPK